MRFTATVGLALVLLVPGVALGQAPAAGDDAAIRRVVQQHDQTRTTGHWRGTAGRARGGRGDAHVLGGMAARARAGIEKGGATTGAGVYKGAKYSTTIRRSA